jgi:serine phosphatase RsbU (regulator of sigma subunit)
MIPVMRQYPREGVQAVVRQCRGQSAQAALEALDLALEAHTGGEAPDDDRTAIAIRKVAP